METRGRPGKEDRAGREKEKRKGHQEWDKGSEGSDWKRFRDMSPSFKSYSLTNKLLLSLPPSHARLTASWLPWWGGLPIAAGGGVVPWDWQWRQLASDCPSVCPSPCVRMGLWTARCPSPQLNRSVCLSVCLPIYLPVFVSVVVLVSVCSPESGDDPRISVEMKKVTGQWLYKIPFFFFFFLNFFFSFFFFFFYCYQSFFPVLFCNSDTASYQFIVLWYPALPPFDIELIELKFNPNFFQ